MGVETRAVAMLLSFLSLFSGAMSGAFPAEQDPASLTVLVNREHPLPKAYEPELLVLPNVPPARGKENAILLRPEAADALELLFQDAMTAGHTLYAVSGYRSYRTQSSLFQRKADAVGEKRAMRSVAPPGASEHQLGLAMDINGESTVNRGLTEAFGASPEGLWVADNAHHYGFLIRYPQDAIDITGYVWEPWHLRYVGIEVAGEVFALEITYEEYCQLLQEKRVLEWLKEGLE